VRRTKKLYNGVIQWKSVIGGLSTYTIRLCGNLPERVELAPNAGVAAAAEVPPKDGVREREGAAPVAAPKPPPVAAAPPKPKPPPVHAYMRYGSFTGCVAVCCSVCCSLLQCVLQPQSPRLMQLPALATISRLLEIISLFCKKAL